MNRPVILGMVKNDIAKEVLDPSQGSGRRLVDMIGREVFDKFDRMNLLDGAAGWRNFAARRAAVGMRDKLRGRTVMVLGNRVWDAMNLPSECHQFNGVRRNGSLYYRVPHPSGLDRVYNDPGNREAARLLFRAVAYAEE